ncbi:MAG: hypothetical protein IMZ62_15990 [Chloroflexi bacterium]|nr:hypothetical protein [Chloroflexota bacterium]
MNTELLRRKTMEIMSRHRGPENAIKRDELLFQLMVWDVDLHTAYTHNRENADRAVRKIYVTLPIASSDAGLYVPRTPAELAGFKEYMTRAYGNERAYARVKVILAYYPGLAEDSMKQQDLGI